MTKHNNQNELNIVSKAVYTIEYLVYDNGQTTLNRTADGFNAFELLGILDLTKTELIQQINGEIKPDIITRKVVKDKE